MAHFVSFENFFFELWNRNVEVIPYLIPVSELFDSYDPEIGFGGIHGRGRRKQDPPIERELYLTLEEVFKGCVKKMKISRRVRNGVIERLRFTFMPNGKRQFVPRDQVCHLIVVNCLLLLHRNK